MEKKEIVLSNAKQSSEVTDGLLQYTKYTLKCWEKTVAILREEVLDKGQRFGKRCPGGLFLLRVCGNDFFKRIDPIHPDRATDALRDIFAHPIVIKKPLFFGVSFISTFEDLENGDCLIEFTNNVVRHYLADDLSVEYDASLVTSFRRVASAFLYKKACMLKNGISGCFDMTEEQIRLTFSIDLIDDVKKLKERKIKVISDLPVISSDEYGRFDDLIKRVIQPGVDEIYGVYKEGRCPFYLTPEIITKKQWTGKRGKPKYEYALRFFIEYEDYSATEEVAVEDAVVIEEVPLPISEASKPLVTDKVVIQTEIPFEYDNDLKTKLQKFREEVTEIFRKAKAPHTKPYIVQLSAMIKERYSSYPTLPSAILAWIDFTRKEVLSQNKEPLDLCKMLQSRIELYCHVYYCGPSKKNVKKKRHEGEDFTPLFPLCVLSLEEEKNIISGSNDFFKTVGDKCELSEDAIRKQLDSFYDDREKNGDNYCYTVSEVVERFSGWLYPSSSESTTDASGTSSDETQSYQIKETKFPNSNQKRWTGEDQNVYKDVNDEVEILRTDAAWKKTVFNRFKFLGNNEKMLYEYLGKWCLEVLSQGIKHECLGDAKSHFTKWLINQEDKYNKNNNSYGTNNNNGYRTSEDIYAGAARIIAKLDAEGQEPDEELPVV